MQVQLATKRLIDAVWTIAYTLDDDGRATIHGHSRLCRRGYANEQRLPRGSFIESDDHKRTALQLVVQPHEPFRYWPDAEADDATIYDVANPQNVFSYGEIPGGE
jgi:hypothetical protein